MSEFPLMNNSLAWVHYRMKGGLRNAFMIAMAYFLVVGGLMVLSVRVEPTSISSTMNGWMVALLLLQVAILVLYGSTAVRNVIRKDYTTGMISSHRLMPISGTEAMIGYIFGPAAHPLALAAANLLLGVLAAGPGKVDVNDWLLGNGLLVLFAVCSWIAVACITLISPKSAGAMFAAVMILSIPGSMILIAVPALTAICSPLVGPSLYGLVMKGAKWDPVLHTSTFAQLAVTIMFFIAGTRKLRRDDVLAVGPLFGLVIVGVFVTISIAAITNWASLQPMLFRLTSQMTELQLISSTVLGLLLGFVPISAAAWMQEDYRRRKLLGDAALGRKQVSFAAVAVVAAAMITVLGACCDPTLTFRSRPLIVTFACITAAMLPVGCVMRWRYRTRSTAASFICAWIVLTWVGPWLISALMLMSHGVEEASRISNAWERSEFVTGFSPIGTLIAVWATPGSKVVPGLVFQVLIALTMLVLSHVRRKEDSEIVVPVLGSV